MKYFLIFLFSFSFNLNGQKKFSNLDVFNLQYAQDPQISYNGKKIVYVRTMMDKMRIDTYDHKGLLIEEGEEKERKNNQKGKAAKRKCSRGSFWVWRTFLRAAGASRNKPRSEAGFLKRTEPAGPRKKNNFSKSFTRGRNPK